MYKIVYEPENYYLYIIIDYSAQTMTLILKTQQKNIQCIISFSLSE